MANQIQIAYTIVAVGGVTTAQLQTAMNAVPLYTSPTLDPVLCQGMGLTVATDATTISMNNVTRTITLNMTAAVGAPLAPPFFPTHTLPADSLAAVYSSSADDALGGIGATQVLVTYQNAALVTETSRVTLAGLTPVQIPLVGGIKIASVTAMSVASVGSFGSSRGQITVAQFTPPTQFIPPGGTLTQDANQIALGDHLGYMPPSYFNYSVPNGQSVPTAANLKALVTNLFTNQLSLALAAQVVAAAPILI